MATTPVLYSYHKSSASWRIRIALYYKQLPFIYSAVALKSVSGSQHDPSFVQLNPSAQVPVLHIDGHHLIESVAIAEYLDETRPDFPLYPRDAPTRARVRALVEAINAGIQPKQNLSTLDFLETLVPNRPELRKLWAAHWNRRGLAAVENLLQRWSGSFCIGDEFSFADCCLVPQVYSARRFGVDMTEFPTITRIFTHLETLPVVQAAHSDRQPDAPRPN